jgi:hypothetical protein
MRAWFLASAVAAIVAVGFAMEARSAQLQPGGAVPYQSNNSPGYLTNTPVIGHVKNTTGAMHGTSFGCVRTSFGTKAVPNPGTAGPALTGNLNNCGNIAPGSGVIGPH